MVLEMKKVCEKCAEGFSEAGEAFICALRMHILCRLRAGNGIGMPELWRRVSEATAPQSN